MKIILLILGLGFMTIAACDTPQPATGNTEDSTSVYTNPDSIKMNTPDSTRQQ